jgi:hypothetical protein
MNKSKLHRNILQYTLRNILILVLSTPGVLNLRPTCDLQHVICSLCGFVTPYDQKYLPCIKKHALLMS